MGTKKCTKCKEEKPTEEFAESTRSADGFASVCNSCKEAAVAPPPDTEPENQEDEDLLIADMLGDIEKEKEEKASIVLPKKKRMLRGPDGFLYVWTPILARKPGITQVEV